MTKIQEKLGVHPIFLPQQQFQDIFGKANAYLEMNPAMYISDKGRVTVLVRCINYRKFQDKQFSLYEPKSNSRYFLLTGTVSQREQLDLERLTVTEIQYSYNLPKYPSYWTGPEDIRFLDENTVLAVIPELNSGGAPTIFKATLDAEQAMLKNFQPCLPNTSSEKNWMPFAYNKVIYSLYPFTVKSVSSDIKEEISTRNESLKGYHGSTNGIPYGNTELLFLIHANREKSYHRWLRYNLVEKSVHISEEFTFFKNTYIEFPCSLSEWNHTYYVGLGVNDDKAMIVEISKYVVQTAKWVKISL